MKFCARKIFLGALLFLLGAGGSASAAIHLPEERERIRQSLHERVDQRREKSEEKTRSQPSRTQQTEPSTALRQRGEETRAMMAEKRKEFKKQMGQRRAEAETRIQEKRTRLKERLANIKDERKRAAVERIDQQMDALNTRLTDHLSNVLEKLDGVLERISSRADKAAERGLTVAGVREATTAATSAIASARESVKTQAGKTYALAITTEDKLKADVGAARRALHADLAKVRDAVKSARDAVHQAATMLAQIPRVDEEVQSTPTPASAPSTSNP